MSSDNEPIIQVKNEVTDITQPSEQLKKNKRQYKTTLKHSNFFLTINTNQRFRIRDERDVQEVQEFANRFKDTLTHIFDNIQQYLKVPEDSEWNRKYFENINVESAVERSPDTDTVHAHILIKVDHRTKVQLDYDAIKNYILEQMGLPNIHLFNRVYFDTHATLEDYIFKNRNNPRYQTVLKN